MDKATNVLETEGVNAWLDSHVPCRISSNSLCAAQLENALVFYNDWISQQQQSINGSISLCEQNETLTVLELGAGHGSCLTILRCGSKRY